RVLITGGAGFIGSHLADALVEHGDAVMILDDLSTGTLENIAQVARCSSVTFVHGSVLDEALVDGAMDWADVCLHMASAVGVRLVVTRPLDSLLGNLRGSD